uniref:helix-turn-helix domain-containing protein n=1 Tax=Agathobacter sp. TaxID=2021311 RepID=UPI003FF0DCE1
MMRAYDELYLGKARMTLAWMFDYAVNGCRIEIEDFYRMFLMSSYARRFETGNCSVVAGLSGVELAQRVIWEHDEQRELPKPIFSLDRSPEYWLGFYLSYYQWYNNLKFEQITSKVTIRDILLMYRKYHEMDVMHFVVALDEMRQERQVARLQEYRKRICLSQRELAEKADVPLRTIQQYEQKQKNINHARVDYVIRLAQALYCRPDDLMEL